jgi:hypothetical protein
MPELAGEASLVHEFAEQARTRIIVPGQSHATFPDQANERDGLVHWRAGRRPLAAGGQLSELSELEVLEQREQLLPDRCEAALALLDGAASFQLALLPDHPQAQRRQDQVGNKNRGQQQEHSPPEGAGPQTETHSSSLYVCGPHRLVTAPSREGKNSKSDSQFTYPPGSSSPEVIWDGRCVPRMSTGVRPVGPMGV